MLDDFLVALRLRVYRRLDVAVRLRGFFRALARFRLTKWPRRLRKRRLVPVARFLRTLIRFRRGFATRINFPTVAMFSFLN
jgi:hypothetical protein